jgi:hypothetical protein
MGTSFISSTSIALSALMKLKGVGRRAALRIVDRPIPDSWRSSPNGALLWDRAGSHRLQDPALPAVI